MIAGKYNDLTNDKLGNQSLFQPDPKLVDFWGVQAAPFRPKIHRKRWGASPMVSQITSAHELNAVETV